MYLLVNMRCILQRNFVYLNKIIHENKCDVNDYLIIYPAIKILPVVALWPVSGEWKSWSFSEIKMKLK